jgi:hypothetical protein
LDDSCTSNSKSEIGNWTGPIYSFGYPKSQIGLAAWVQFPISDFEFEVQDSSNFKFPPSSPCATAVTSFILNW